MVAQLPSHSGHQAHDSAGYKAAFDKWNRETIDGGLLGVVTFFEEQYPMVLDQIMYILYDDI